MHAFFFVLALAAVLISGAGLPLAGTNTPGLVVARVATVFFLVYLYRAMREVYRQGHALTAVKYIVLGGSYFMAAILTLVGAVIFTAAWL